MTRVLPNKVALSASAEPRSNGLSMEFRIENGSAESITGLDVQMCVMLKSLSGFERCTNDNKLFQPPFSAAHDSRGDRWIITAWENCRRAWGNASCPCLHSDPRVEDCPPGESRSVRGWVSFYEGREIQAELRRISREVFEKR